MLISSNKVGKTLTVILQGAFDYSAAADFKNYMSDKYRGTWELIMDLMGLEYISSAGMRVLLECELAMKKCGGMKLVNVPDSVMEVIKMAGFDRFLNIE